MNNPVRNISEVSAKYGLGGRGGLMGLGRGGWGGQGGRGGYKVPPLTAVQIDAFAHISYQYFSDKNYKYLSAAEKSKL